MGADPSYQNGKGIGIWFENSWAGVFLAWSGVCDDCACFAGSPIRYVSGRNGKEAPWGATRVVSPTSRRRPLAVPSELLPHGAASVKRMMSYRTRLLGSPETWKWSSEVKTEECSISNCAFVGGRTPWRYRSFVGHFGTAHQATSDQCPWHLIKNVDLRGRRRAL